EGKCQNLAANRKMGTAAIVWPCDRLLVLDRKAEDLTSWKKNHRPRRQSRISQVRTKRLRVRAIQTSLEIESWRASEFSLRCWGCCFLPILSGRPVFLRSGPAFSASALASY